MSEALQQLLAQTRPLKFGDHVVCIFASENNPQRKGLFVRWKTKRHGAAEVTDGRGTFWTNYSVFHADDTPLFGALHEAIWQEDFPDAR